MIDFFDEDFPLTKKQEEALLAAKNKRNTPDMSGCDGIRPAEAKVLGVSADISAAESDAFSDAITAESTPAQANNEGASEQPVPEQADEVCSSDKAELTDENKEVNESAESEKAALADEESEQDASNTHILPLFESELNAEDESDIPQADIKDESFDLDEKSKVPTSNDKPSDETNNIPEHIIDSAEVLLQLGTSGESRSDSSSCEALSSSQKSLDDIDAALHAELKSLVEKLDDMERFVDTMDFAKDDTSDSDSTDFTYEYDDRYFAEEETPAYKYPELYKKPERSKQMHKKETKSDNINLSINKKTLFKVGAIVAAAAAAVTIFSDKDD